MPLYQLDGQEPEAAAARWIAPDAILAGRVRLGAGSSVWFSACLRGDNEWIEIGEGSNIQDLCMLHTDPGYPLTIGANCTVGHRAILHGCTVGDNVLVGMGAIILNGARVGADSLIGAGALIPEGKAVPPGMLMLGSPAKPKRALTPEEIARNRMAAEGYQANARRFACGLTGGSPD